MYPPGFAEVCGGSPPTAIASGGTATVEVPAGAHVAAVYLNGGASLSWAKDPQDPQAVKFFDTAALGYLPWGAVPPGARFLLITSAAGPAGATAFAVAFI